MTTFNPGDKVLFSLNHADRTGTIQREALRDEHGWIIDADDPRPGPWFAFSHEITAIPADAPIFTPADRVQVNTDAPHYAGRVGAVDGPAIRDDMFGYWLWLDRPEEPAWIPAEALSVFEGGASQ
jgi:hypothetical protein